MPRESVVSLLRCRPACLGLAGMAVAHAGLTAVGKQGWPCPFRDATGLPCPGCGLTGAAVLLFHGDISRALRMHAFVPVAVVAVGFVALGAVLPDRWVNALAGHLERIDNRARISTVILALLVIYWIARLVLDF